MPVTFEVYPFLIRLPNKNFNLQLLTNSLLFSLSQEKKKEKKSKKKEKKVEEAEDAGEESGGGGGGEDKAKDEPKRAQRATSNVFALFNQAQIQEFKEVRSLRDVIFLSKF